MEQQTSLMKYRETLDQQQKQIMEMQQKILDLEKRINGYITGNENS